MELFYRIMGLTARLSERGSRYRVNGIGLNWWILIGIITFGCLATAQVIEARKNREGATSLALAKLLADDAMVDRFVSVKGVFDTEGALSKEKKDAKADEPEEVWVPLVDEAAGQAVYVKLKPDTLKDEEHANDGSVRGMLRRMDTDFRSYVAKNAPEVAGIRINDRYVLVAGEKPATLGVWMGVSALLWLVGLMIVWSIVRRYVIFRRSETPAPPRFKSDEPDRDASPVLRASGVFVFNQKDRRRFLGVSALPAEMASGDPAIVSKLDASENFFGNTTRNLDGMWAIVMKSGTLSSPEYGQHYAGWTPRLALRISYIDAISGKSQRVVLSFENDDDRRYVRRELYEPKSPTTPADSVTQDT